MLADSKGNYLKSHANLINQFHYSTEFQCRGGARFQDYFYWLQHNLSNKVAQYGKIVLYVWLGSCDFTVKSDLQDPTVGHRNFKKKHYIQLRHVTDSEAVSYLKYQIDRYLSFVSNFPSVSVVFLEIPPYSIKQWNRNKGYRNPGSFHSQNLILLERISLVNEYIRFVNENNSVTSPRFKIDLLTFRKSKSKQTKRVNISYSLYKDGVRPQSLLARCWMKRLVTQILVDCA